MQNKKPANLVERSTSDRRASADRRKGENAMIQTLFKAYQFQDERVQNNRRTGPRRGTATA